MRCRTPIKHPCLQRYQLQAADIARSTGSLYDGQLCKPCWDDLLQFLWNDTPETEVVPA